MNTKKTPVQYLKDKGLNDDIATRIVKCKIFPRREVIDYLVLIQDKPLIITHFTLMPCCNDMYDAIILQWREQLDDKLKRSLSGEKNYFPRKSVQSFNREVEVSNILKRIFRSDSPEQPIPDDIVIETAFSLAFKKAGQ